MTPSARIASIGRMTAALHACAAARATSGSATISGAACCHGREDTGASSDTVRDGSGRGRYGTPSQRYLMPVSRGIGGNLTSCCKP